MMSLLQALLCSGLACGVGVILGVAMERRRRRLEDKLYDNSISSKTTISHWQEGTYGDTIGHTTTDDLARKCADEMERRLRDMTEWQGLID